ncbi:hypothetical protein LTR62_003796 [Meristemomyces frigidus]|uniref:Uncharacterized protein n=1 Tax=Meristemomyces frigidus TaxID=1508187 RepID=A0AAN7TH65_9PEZI|nr:hypothetical protein LTR62_003796 [Meristemomyces frigidus]
MAEAIKNALRPSQDRSTSHGRGGAGNIKLSSNSGTDPKDLTTPIIKSDLYTTGRGGQGNMATNLHSHPEFARAAQDVEAHDAANREPARGTYHWGRGGQGNMVTLGSGESKVVAAGAKEQMGGKGGVVGGEKTGERRESFKGVKSRLGLGGKEKERGEKERREGESAVE